MRMSREAFEVIINDFRTWDWQDAFSDKICLHDVSKELRGEFRVQQADNQDCEAADCTTLKHYSEFKMEIAPGPCDSQASASLSGVARGQVVAAFGDSNVGNRGGHTGRFEWQGQSSGLYGRLRGIVNACTHHDPVVQCLECHTPDHADGWIRAAIFEGDHEGCRVAANYSMTIARTDDGGSFEGTMEGVIICQCAEEGG